MQYLKRNRINKKSTLALSILCASQLCISSASAKTYSDNNLSLPKGKWVEYYLDVPAGTSQLKVEISGGSGDADLWVFNKNHKFECSPWLNGNNETCTFKNPVAGKWHVELYGYKAFSGVSLKTVVTPESTTPAPDPTPDPTPDPSSEPVINLKPDGWDAMGANNVKAITLSAANTLLENIPGVSLDPIILGNTAAGPITYFNRGSNNEYLIDIDISGAFWAQLTYQFAHEYMHVLSNYGGTASDPNQWFEEALCEAASMQALKRMSISWQTNAPLSHLQSYAPSMESYFNDLINEDVRQLQPGDTIAAWYEREKSSLRANAGLRDKNEVIGNKIYKYFAASPDRWRSVRYLNLGITNKNITLEEYLNKWKASLPTDLKYVAATVSGWFGY